MINENCYGERKGKCVSLFLGVGLIKYVILWANKL